MKNLQKETDRIKKFFTRIISATLILFLLQLEPAYPTTTSTPSQYIVNNVRIQLLSPTLIRIEQKGPKGFEDRKTITVIERNWPKICSTILEDKNNNFKIVQTENYKIHIPADGSKLTGTEILDKEGKIVFRAGVVLPKQKRFPGPHELEDAFIVIDSPRIVPSRWGYTPVPKNKIGSLDDTKETSGWDLKNDAPDIYVFINTEKNLQGLQHLRDEYIRLTGPVPMLPNYLLGLTHSRFHPYTEKSALEIIDRYRTEGIPIDIWVVDTHWRVGGSTGYEINKEYFPNFGRFVHKANNRHVRLILNDHGKDHGLPLEPKHVKYRWDNLTRMLTYGIDFLWYDRNWPETLTPPAGIDRAFWGQIVYTDILKRFRPNLRPVSMNMRSNTSLESGSVDTTYVPHPASHRYPDWWTGDPHAIWPHLKSAVHESVDDGVQFLPWVHQDATGHLGMPTPELFSRWMQWASLSPLLRLHCTTSVYRYPWAFGKEAQQIATEYTKLRYRLLPVIYTAARRTYDQGFPVLRRMDLYWPELTKNFSFPDDPSHLTASFHHQYLLGDDILIAPVYESICPPAKFVKRNLWIPPGQWQDAWTGKVTHGPKTIQTESLLWHTPMYIRRPGIILTLPQMYHIYGRPWNTVIVDAFPADGSTQRSLYEDDGLTRDYKIGKFARTKITMHQKSAKKISLSIGSQHGDFKGRLTKRTWLVRIHLKPGQTPKSLKVNNKAVPFSHNTQNPTSLCATVLNPPSPSDNIDKPLQMPFSDKGSKPGFNAGPIVEISLPKANTSSSHKLFLELE